MGRHLRVVALAASVLGLLLPATPVAAAPADAANGQRSTFIVTLRDGEPHQVAAEHARRYDADVEFVYEHALRGYAATMSDARMGELARDRRVERIERDQVVHANETQSDATWGLDRIDARSGLDESYTYDATGAGVTAYIIDTGIRVSHGDFGGRAQHGYDAVDKDYNTSDCNGHGTHVAGTVGGTTYGVAKAVKLVGVRVLDCNGSGSWSGVIAGIDWVTGNAVKPAVANMSLGGGASTSVDAAVSRSITAGVSYSIAAGNGNRGGKEQDACGYSPARVPEAMTIGATSQNDAKTSWSNYGTCVDWFAPGYQITSAWHSSNTATNTISGTSMAAPHTAGVAALYLQGTPGASPADVHQALYDRTTKGIVTSSNTADNHLLYSLSDEDAGDVVDDPVVEEPPAEPGDPSIAVWCNKTDCTFDATPDVADAQWDFDRDTEGDLVGGDPITHSYDNVLDTYTVDLWDGTTFVTSVIVDCTTQKGPWYHCSATG